MANKLPYNLWHRDRQRQAQQDQPKEKPLFGLAYSDSSIIESAVVRIKFTKAGARNDGNGFFVNVPGAAKDVIFTAGHNLIDEKKNRCTDISILYLDTKVWIPIKDEDVRISKKYEENPTPASAVDDYGIIMLDKPAKTEKPRPGLGFALKLAEEDSLRTSLSVTGYKSGSPEGSRPTTSTGRCINPIVNRNQLEYLVETEAGISGSPVWLGYQRYPTVVAIHNYGPRMKKPKYGSRGTRINLKVLQEIFEWVGVLNVAKTMKVRGTKPPSIPLPLYLTWSKEDGVLRVVVEKSTDSALTQFNMLPAYAPPIEPGIAVAAEFAFSQSHADGTYWVSWNVPSHTATMVNDIRSARLGRWIGTKRNGSVELSCQGNIWHLSVRTDSAVVKKWDLADTSAEFSGVDFQTPDNPLDGSFSKFSLEDAV